MRNNESRLTVKYCCLKLPIIAGLWLSGLLCAAPLQYKIPLFQREAGLGLVLDPYRSFTNAYLGLRCNPEVMVYDENELALYTNLFSKSTRITHLLVEGTVYPLAWTTAYLCTNHGDLYTRFTIFRDINILSSLAGGMREPWSGSLFLGQIASFLYMDDQEKVSVVANGINGIVLTAGTMEIFDDYLFPAHWYRLEWKLKGSANLNRLRHEWEIKLGYRWYGIPQIDNDFMLTINREKFQPQVWNWGLKSNSRAELELHLPPRDIRNGWSLFKISVGKVFPLKQYLLGGSLGINYEYRRVYCPNCRCCHFSPKKQKIWSLIVQPILIW